MTDTGNPVSQYDLHVQQVHLEALTIQFVDRWNRQSPLDTILVFFTSGVSNYTQTRENGGTESGIGAARLWGLRSNYISQIHVPDVCF